MSTSDCNAERVPLSSRTVGQTYYYYVQAVNGVGSSPSSTIQFATTNANSPPIHAAPGSLTLTSATTPSVTLNWTASLTATSYIINRSISAYGAFSPIASGTTTTTYLDLTVVSGTTYFYTFQAVNASWSSSASTIQSITPYSGAIPTAPTNLTATVVP